MNKTQEFYHRENHDMWMKGCIPLGQFITESEHKLDLGIWLNPSNGNPSFAIVYGDEGHQYISGTLSQYSKSGAIEADNPKNDYFNETIKRYNEYLKNKETK
tara:strand:- start:1874 stop:2179 length:306 start_codon:yes stop_codon:yes gene_type:complete